AQCAANSPGTALRPRGRLFRPRRSTGAPAAALVVTEAALELRPPWRLGRLVVRATPVVATVVCHPQDQEGRDAQQAGGPEERRRQPMTPRGSNPPGRPHRPPVGPQR